MKSGRINFNRPLTEAEIQQLLRERDERIDPANRPENAEVDNSTREWDYELNDFRDSIESRPPGYVDVTEQGPPIREVAVRRSLGTILVLICAFFLWLSWAFFSKTFTEYDEVAVTMPKSGLSLPQRADVKLRGMNVGIVRDVQLEGDRVVLTLGMDPELIDRVPADVRAEIIPKTLFGEKYVSLIPTGTSGASLKAGDTITDAVVPVEFEEFFNDIYPILTAVPPDKVAYTLTALANTLEGRGDELGNTLETSNDYLRKLNPETQQAVDDIVQLGRVSQTYAKEMKNFGKLLRNSAELSETVVDKEDELADLFDETDDLSNVLRTFLAAAGEDIIATARNSVKPLAVGADYSTVFPCMFKGIDAILRTRLDSALKNNTLHINMTVVSPQATQYEIANERPTVPTQATLDATSLSDPHTHGYDDEGTPLGLGTICDELNAAAAGNPRAPGNPPHYTGEFWGLWGIKHSHNGKLGTDADYNRAPVSTVLEGVDTPAQRHVLNRMTTALTGVKTESVPDVASLLISPVVRGTSSVEAYRTGSD